ncbi:MAG: sel1 repeat family protein [Verrucomicrobia bacterium]|nr:sel1 repeat family protein [Verrucomicrobiota bacterium]
MSKSFALFFTRRFLVWAGCACWVVALCQFALCAAVAPTVNGSNRSFADLRESAAKGDAIAQRLVANAYLAGDGVNKDVTEALKWLRLAAEQHDPPSEFTLGILYDEGRGLPRDVREAVKWYERAAVAGLSDAQFNLADCYVKGEGVPMDMKKACDWFRRAAEQGDGPSQARLGLAYVSGKGVERDINEAVKWFRSAAYPPHNIATAQYYLGRLYQEGEGVPQDMEYAYAWYSVSAHIGNVKADAAMHAAAAKLAPAEMQSASLLSTDLIQKYGTVPESTSQALGPTAAPKSPD